MSSKIKTHVVTGFLGAGKTSFLNELLKQAAFKDSAVIINEFGEVSLDHLLVEQSDDQIIELANGCICCTIRGQLIDTLQTVLERKPARIIIETTGLADPLPVLQAILHAPNINEQLEYAGLITIVDGLAGREMLKQHTEVQKQISLADLICISKLDVNVDEKQASRLQDLHDEIRLINPLAGIIDKERLLANPEILFDLTKNFEIEKPDDHAQHHHSDSHSHSDTVAQKDQIKCVTLYFEKPIERAKIDMFTQLLLSAHGPQIIRLKGLVAISGKEGPLLLQSVGSILSEPQMIDSWPSEDQTTRIVVFIEGMEEAFLQRLFQGFMGVPQIDTADADAHSNSPLTIAGFNPKL